MKHTVARATTWSTVTDRDRNDALRIIEAATTIAAIPGLTSAEARQLAAGRLRELIPHHPRSAEILYAVVQHLESYQ